ncbi:MAG: LysM peptidoglycan-binding domain-containing protein, partial [Candidatus Atribacteria bacterium]|nr:LysM peptidoglycan-binding domain-containing protein [Candidatus Atribacteria bacterium]MCD6350007.1 LysM peptidoglycan-binding domain-containing protein [Candidatus Atribacteria bacterium]
MSSFGNAGDYWSKKVLKIRNVLVLSILNLVLLFLTTLAWSSVVHYIVQPGDTLWEISRKQGVSLEDLMDANGLTEDSVLRVGAKLVIPSK